MKGFTPTLRRSFLNVIQFVVVVLFAGVAGVAVGQGTAITITGTAAGHPTNPSEAQCPTGVISDISDLTFSGTLDASANLTVTNCWVRIDSDLTLTGININGGARVYGGVAGTDLQITSQFYVNSGNWYHEDGTVKLNSTIASDGSGGASGVATVQGPGPGSGLQVGFNDVVIPTGSVVDFGLGEVPGGTDYAESEIGGSLYLEGGAVITNTPIYESGSTLVYKDGSAGVSSYTIGAEWTVNASSGKGVPHHVEVTNASTLQMITTSSNHYTCLGNLTVDGAANGTLDLSSMEGNLVVTGNVSIAPNNSGQIVAPSTEGKGSLKVDGNFTVASGGTIVNSEGKIEVKGNFDHDGQGGTLQTLVLNGGATQTVTYDYGGGPQTLAVDSLIVINTRDANLATDDVTLSCPVEIRSGGIFDPQDGTVAVGSSLTMKSDANGTARIATLSNAAGVSNVTGNTITFERYVNWVDGFTGLMMGNYVNGLTVQNWIDDFSSPIYTYKWDETANANGSGLSNVNGWTYQTAATGLDNDGTGYVSYVPDGVNGAVTMSNAGTYNTANVTVALTHTDGSGFDTAIDPPGWNLLSNPFPCPISGDKFMTAATQGGSASITDLYVYSNASGNWLQASAAGALSWTAPVDDGNANTSPNIIDIGQSFYAYVASGNGGTAVFDCDPLSANYHLIYGGNTFVREVDPMEIGIFALKTEYEDGKFGGTTIRLHEEATGEFQSELDAPFKESLNGEVPQVFSISEDGWNLSVNAVGNSTMVDPVGLTVISGQGGLLSIGLDDLTTIPEGWCVRIEDLETGESAALGSEILEVELAANETFEDRFVLSFLNTPVFESSVSHCEGGTIHFIGDDAAFWNITWSEVSGSSDGTGCVSGLDPGTYDLDATNFLNGCAASAQVTIEETCLGDFNMNGGRDITDLLTLLVEMQPVAGSNGNEILYTDCDCDGLMTTSDLLLFLPYFGVSCE
ncbi:MAG: hypothetical protein P8K81_06720 [Flavobacteriales bacterium]|nr:hypothetical protein [Flavobacteriales bacterium]